MLGPLLGALVHEWAGARCVFLLAGLLSFTALLLVLLLMPETCPAPSRAPLLDLLRAHLLCANPLAVLVLQQDRRLRALALPFAAMFLVDGSNVIFVLHMRAVLGASARQVGYYLSAYGVLATLYNGFALPRLVPAVLSDERAVVLLMGLEALRLLCCGLARSLPAFFLVLALFACTTMYHSSLKTIVYNASRERAQGGTCLCALAYDVLTRAGLQGALGSVRTLSLGVGGMLFSLVYSLSLQLGSEHSHTLLAFLLAALLMAGACIYCALLFAGSKGDGDASQEKVPLAAAEIE